MDKFYYNEYIKKKEAGKAHPDYLAEIKFLSQIDGLHNEKNKQVKLSMEFYKGLIQEGTPKDEALDITIHKSMAWAFGKIIKFVNKQSHKKT